MTEKERRQTVRVTNIQRFCLHDGPGIRTTVFLKGCTLHCPWCCNPENISCEIQTWRDPDTGETGTYGYDISLGDLARELLKDRGFYLDGGGVTFSGGEPLLQVGKYEPLLRELKAEKVHLAVETALFVGRKQVEIASRYFDWWYVDMKVPEPNLCRQLLGGDMGQYMGNLRLLSQNAPELHIRIPCAHGITDTAENMAEIVRRTRMLNINQVALFGIHDLARDKYRRLNRAWTVDVSQSETAVRTMAGLLQNCGVSCRVMYL